MNPPPPTVYVTDYRYLIDGPEVPETTDNARDVAVLLLLHECIVHLAVGLGRSLGGSRTHQLQQQH